MLKKIKSVLFLFTLLLAFSFFVSTKAEATPSLTINAPASASIGETITINITGDDITDTTETGVAALEFVLSYDESLLTFDDFEDVADQGSFDNNSNYPSGGYFVGWTCDVDDGDPIPLSLDGNQVFITFTFTVAGSSASPVPLTFTGGEASNWGSEVIDEFDFIGDNITLNEAIPSDGGNSNNNSNNSSPIINPPEIPLVTTIPIVCQTGQLFNITTGQPCNTYTPTPAQPVVLCLQGQIYNIITGQLCTAYKSNSEQTLDINRTLKVFMQGEDVRQLQIYFNTHNYIVATFGNGFPNNETTYFGQRTKNAVIKFQIANGLSPDGVCGVKCREKISQNL